MVEVNPPQFWKEPDQVIRTLCREIARAMWGKPSSDNCTSAQRRQARNIAQNIKRALDHEGLLAPSKGGHFDDKDRKDAISLTQEHTTDPVELLVGAALEAAGYKPMHEGHPARAGYGPTLDFELSNGLYIEVKRMHSPRIEKQMAQAENVIAIQGMAAAEWFAKAISGEG